MHAIMPRIKDMEIERERSCTSTSISSTRCKASERHGYPLAVAAQGRSMGQAVKASVEDYRPIYSRSNVFDQLSFYHPYLIEVIEEQPEFPANSMAIRTFSQDILEKDTGVIQPSHKSRRGTFPSRRAWFLEGCQQLKKLAYLQENWDSYGAEPPNSVALGWAHQCLNILQTINFAPTKITPSVENGVGISFISGKKYADIECFNTGEVLAVTSDGQGNPIVWEVQPTNQGIKSALGKIRVFLQN
jgi:hypothetical protein